MTSESLASDILTSRGGLAKNNLINMLEKLEDIDTTIFHASESPYIDIDCVPEFVKKYNDKFTILNLNVQSLNAKYDSFRVFIQELATADFHFSVISLQETWLSNKADINNFLLPDYNAIARNATCSSHSGLVTYVHKKFRFAELNLYDTSNMWEGIFVEVSGGGLKKKLNLCNIYRPPRDRNADIQMFLEEIGPILNTLSQSQTEVIFSGDINIDLLKVDSRITYSAYLEMMYSLSFLPCITLPTRLSRRNATLIDHVFYKSGQSIVGQGGIFLSNISDHLMTFTSLNLNVNKSLPPKLITIQESDVTSKNNFKRALENSNLYDKLDLSPNVNPNANYEILKENVTLLLDEHLPIKRVKFRKYKHKHQPWFTFGIIKSIKNRDRLYRKLKSLSPYSNSYHRSKINLTTYNNILRKSMRAAKFSYYNNIFHKYKTDSKKTWSLINTLIGASKSKKSVASLFTINNQTITNEEIIAEHFNTFFSSIGSRQASKIQSVHASYKQYLISPANSIFTFTTVTDSELTEIINKFCPKSSTGNDNVSMKLLKECSLSLVPSLVLIINQSLASGICPDAIKIAKVIPLFKKGSMSLMDNYRPISLLPCFSKLFEKVVHIQLYEYFSHQKLLYSHQHGFRKQHSTESATLQFVDRVLSYLDNNKTPFSIFIDLSKAFDTLDHEILLDKLHYYGVKETPLKWFKSYFANRFQYVDYCGSFSSLTSSSIGVPQGSILGPLLFLIYVNDINGVSPLFEAIFMPMILPLPVLSVAFKSLIQILIHQLLLTAN